jgi:hypothetical protein
MFLFSAEDSFEIHPSSKVEQSDESDVDPMTNGEDSDDDSTDQTWSARQDYGHKNGSGSKSPTKQVKKPQVFELYSMFYKQVKAKSI